MKNEILSLSELAERMCVSKRRVQQFAQDGLVRRIAHGRYIIPKFYVNESRDEELNMAGLEAAIQRELENRSMKKKIVRELADHIATETMDWLQMRGLVLEKSEYPPSPIKRNGYAYQ